MPPNSRTDALVHRFPERADAIRRLFADDENFRAICEEYEVARRALEHWSQSKDRLAKQRVEEYGTILQELEAEALAALDKCEIS